MIKPFFFLKYGKKLSDGVFLNLIDFFDYFSDTLTSKKCENRIVYGDFIKTAEL